eukprot:CAMPEP_0172531710 /NCGR_PEP_ID=MMETSP1067-20121228/4996_1 /TAXON_ID=265564 ORGANISM="Thalassiosira punctigera, Strain Tpunct2005C2" /NCGR_SAMPLE_ID=MMETSP1067 /ASSEMBLY_ACC=CAM_ASM_000444 /LENGTH=689 /DNA_ID=CAMNT_0013316113 /DNA_START=108 /DNA_END=2177 /DNA_ORIENTATION=-
MDFIKDLNIDRVRNLAEDAFNQVKPKNDVEVRVYEVLSHKNWGASTTLMNEIAQDTFDYERFLIVSKLMWEAIETPRPAAWRVIFKGLTLLEHLVKNGSERCVDDARNHSHLLRNLDKFNYYEGTVDRGVGVREKSKQVVEMLQDDERIREERQKARQLREKFAGRSVTASGGGGGGSSGGGEKYPGYGNSDANWNPQGGSRGYGDSGIGSSRNAAADSSDRGYAGRYGEGGVDSGTPSFSKNPSATTASTTKKSSKSSSTTKVKKLKKKEKKAAAAAAAAPEVDLFGFDTPAPAEAADDSFDAFQTGGPAPAPPTLAAPPAAAASNDDFGDFQQIAPTSAVQFDAFGSAPASQQQATFDAFGGAPSMMQQQQPMSAMNNAFGNMSMQNQQGQMMSPAPAAPPAVASAPAPAADNDDFGDFEGAADPFSSAKSPEKSGDPLSKLISLDGLSKNVKKEAKSSAGDQTNVGGPGVFGGGGQNQPGFLTMGGPPILGTGQKGDVGEVFGQLLESGNQPAQGMTAQQQQMIKQRQSNMGGMSMNGGGGMGMSGGSNMGMMGGQPMIQGMMGGQQQQQQGMMNNTMMMNSGGGMMGGQMPQQGSMGMMGGQPQQGNMGMMGSQPQQGNMGMMGSGMGMGGQGGMMQGNNMMQQQQMGMMGGQGQMQQPQMNMMGGNAMGGGMGMMGGQSGQGFR